MRRRVNRALRDRPTLSADEWFVQFWQPLDVSRQIAEFVYTQMATYTGLDFTRVRPDDRLNDDLHLALVCWFDWELSLYEDFFTQFGVDLSDRFDPERYLTIKEFVLFLNQQLLSMTLEPD
ncbi:hypothetical protein ACN4EK_27825 [Pantanalinema rosaneae CENA516]|uniref:hypothetical protein n=1 Tax=Pantanalinema rosaneae TaxID=1620701 RepID=UPI003D700244